MRARNETVQSAPSNGALLEKTTRLLPLELFSFDALPSLRFSLTPSLSSQSLNLFLCFF